jgi:hypothetical protein
MESGCLQGLSASIRELRGPNKNRTYKACIAHPGENPQGAFSFHRKAGWNFAGSGEGDGTGGIRD